MTQTQWQDLVHDAFHRKVEKLAITGFSSVPIVFSTFAHPLNACFTHEKHTLENAAQSFSKASTMEWKLTKTIDRNQSRSIDILLHI